MEQSATPPQPPPPPPPPAPAATDEYPVTFTVEYPDRELSRVSTFFRFFAAIPIFIVLSLVSGGGNYSAYAGDTTTSFSVGAGGVLIAATLIMILFRQKYPRWWFDWNLELTRFSNRVFTYLFLMNDKYPSTDEHQWLRLDITYPDAERDLNRWLPLVKWLLAIPHYIVLAFLYIGAFFATIGAWFAILFTGRYPRGIFDYNEGVFRWSIRVEAYVAILATDKYPPFRLSP